MNTKNDLLKAYLRRQFKEWIILSTRLIRGSNIEPIDYINYLISKVLLFCTSIVIDYLKGKITDKEFEYFLEREARFAINEHASPIPKNQLDKKGEILSNRIKLLTLFLKTTIFNFTLDELEEIFMWACTLAIKKNVDPEEIFKNDQYYSELISILYEEDSELLKKKILSILSIFSARQLNERFGIKIEASKKTALLDKMIEDVANERVRELFNQSRAS